MRNYIILLISAFLFSCGGPQGIIISEEDKDADCTISTSLEVLLKLKNGEVNPMMAVMGGQIKISGDMGLAMKVQSLLS